MENLADKADFLRRRFVPLLQTLDPQTPPRWGKMNVQQMIEHMSEYIAMASGKIPVQVVTPEENLAKMQGFLMSEKPFRENTPNTLMPDTPPPVKHATVAEAIHELQAEIDHFFQAFETDKEQKIANPFFGELNYDMQVQLLHKHATHHLRQFGVC
jgi:hypothetical protein